MHYSDIRESLALILDEEPPDKKTAVLESLDDALGNHSDHLTVVDDMEADTPNPTVRDTTETQS